MRVAIMQPYLFPYIGYFQLIHAVDAFVVYDDVNYMKGGWINRNFILSQGAASRITLPLRGASPNVLINEVEVGGRRECAKLLKTVTQNYAKAPCFTNVIPLIEEILMFEEVNLAKFLDHSLRKLCGYLGLDPRWLISSDLDKDNGLRGQQKVLDICRILEASRYVNTPGGKELYTSDAFESCGIELTFLQPNQTRYEQFGNEFVPNLSIVDVMMFNDKERCTGLLCEYTLA